MIDFHKLTQDISKIYTKEVFEEYLKSYFSEIENYFEQISYDEIQAIKFDMEDLLYNLSDKKLIQQRNHQVINAFLMLLAEKFIQTSMVGTISIVYDFILNEALKKRLEAARLYLKINDISKDYQARCEHILGLLEDSAKYDEYNTKAIKSFLIFIESALKQFQRISNQSFVHILISEVIKFKSKFNFLQDVFLSDFFNNIDKSNIFNTLALTQALLGKIISQKQICNIDTKAISKERGGYANKLYSFSNPNFESIRNISFEYIQSIGDPQELYDRLQRGEKVIDDTNLLYKYLVSFGAKHKAKLDSCYELIINKLQNQKFDIIDWGCGQATATMVLLDYAKKQNLTLDIENITLIEPSSLALSRGLLHIDVLKQKDYNIKAINSDLDCLDIGDIVESKNKILHLFSNILDVEWFLLDSIFLKKVSNTLQNDAIFVCVSPNRGDKHNNRIDMFFNYFDENFDTELISDRDSNIGDTTRYEKIFEVKYLQEVIVEEKRNEIKMIQNTYHIDIIESLSQYERFVTPILDITMIKNSLQNDPEYIIFKIRKVAGVITSKIYSSYESNEKSVSFNDKIRYLTYEKKIFDKTITNYVQTIRTIGNRGVHEDDRAIPKLKLDAHLMIISLISFIQELNEKKILNFLIEN